MAIRGEHDARACRSALACSPADLCPRARRSRAGGRLMATVEQQVRIEPGASQHIDAVMRVMDAAFGDRFGEAWTRSQLGGILPMAGVSLMLAREPDGGHITGFSLYRTVADEAELLLIAVVPSHHRRGVGRMLLDNFLDRARNDGVA